MMESFGGGNMMEEPLEMKDLFGAEEGDIEERGGNRFTDILRVLKLCLSVSRTQLPNSWRHLLYELLFNRVSCVFVYFIWGWQQLQAVSGFRGTEFENKVSRVDIFT